MFEFGEKVAVKICGITNVEDAMGCAAAGADMLGLNFSPQSLRCVSANQAAKVVTAVRAKFPRVKFAAIVVNQERDFVQALVNDLLLDAVQLHGDEDCDFVRTLQAPFVIKALRVGPQFATSDCATYDCDAILLDTWSAHLAGGTGQTFPWSIAAAARPLVRRLFLAGGLSIENIGEALNLVRPFAVDVCSGVEDSPGQKNNQKVRRFIEAVRASNLLPA